MDKYSIHPVCIQSGLFTVYLAMWGPKMVSFRLQTKVLAARPNRREWWVGEKIAATMMYAMIVLLTGRRQ